MLTKEETLMTVARNLEVIHDVDDNVKVTKELTCGLGDNVKITKAGVQCSLNLSANRTNGSVPTQQWTI
jgi:hypothetical protein